MSAVKLDFAAPGSRPGPLSWLLLALGLGLAAAVAYAWQEADAARTLAQANLAALARPAAKPVAKAAKADPALQARLKEDDAARRALALPWSRLLETLQDSLPDDVALLSLDADGRAGTFQLAANAKSHQAMLDYFKDLKAKPGLGEVTLTRHELREIDGLQGVNFSLRGTWMEKEAQP